MDNNNSAQETREAVQKTSKAVKSAKGIARAGKNAAKAGGKLFSAFGWKVVITAVLVTILFAILTNGVPSTSFNSFTHQNENQLLEDEKHNEKSTLKDLTAAKESEIDGINIIAAVFKEKKADAYEKLEKICEKEGVDYETSLQFLDSNFVEIGAEMFESHEEGFYTEEEYDATTVLSAYSISVDNLMTEKNVSDDYVSDIEAAGINKSSLSRAKTVYDVLVDGGCTPQAACGILGNLMAESSLRTNAVSFDGHGSYGIAQWTGGRKTNLKKYCEKHGYSYSSLTGQAHYLLHEIDTGTGFAKLSNCNWSGGLSYLRCSNSIPGYSHSGLTSKEIKSMTSIEKVAVLWINHHERPASGIYHNEEKRIAYAKGFYEKLAGSSKVENAAAQVSTAGNTESGKKHWTQDMRDKLTEYLEGTDLYTIEADIDENGDIIKYEGVVDKDATDDLSDDIKDYEKNVKEDVIETDDKTKDTNGSSIVSIVDKTTIDEYLDSEAYQQQKAEKDKKESGEVTLVKNKYIHTTMAKLGVEEISLNAFGLDEAQVQRVYGNTDYSANEIIREMSYNSLALLHDIDNPKEDMISSDLMSKSYNIGASVGNFNIDYYCGCDKKACVEKRKNLVATANGKLASGRNRVKGVSCAADTTKIPLGTVLYIEGYGFLVVDDVLIGENADNTIAIFIGKKHDTNVKKSVNECSKKKQEAKLVTGLTQADAKNMGNATGTLAWPVGTTKCALTSDYGWRIHPIYGTKRFHTGVDIALNAAPDITAADGGTVTLAEYYGGYGNAVIIKHSDKLSTLYGHCSKLYVKKGQKVSKGQKIGKMGTTGNSTGIHLHFEVQINGQHTDPLKYIPSNYFL